MNKSSKPASEIDRLIELASDEKPHGATLADDPVSSTNALSLEDQKDPRPSMWRVLLQLRVLLPHLVKALPLIERGLLGTNFTGQAASVDTSHFDRGIAATQAAQRDISGALKTQTAEIKFMQGQLDSLSRSLEQETLQREQIAETLASLVKLVKTWAIAVLVLLATLIGLVGFALLEHTFKAG